MSTTKKTIAEKARSHGLEPKSVYPRINRGWPEERLYIPLQPVGGRATSLPLWLKERALHRGMQDAVRQSRVSRGEASRPHFFLRPIKGEFEVRATDSPLRVLRKQEQLTATEVAERVGLHITKYCALETGALCPWGTSGSLKLQAKKCARYFDADPRELWDGGPTDEDIHVNRENWFNVEHLRSDEALDLRHDSLMLYDALEAFANSSKCHVNARNTRLRDFEILKERFGFNREQTAKTLDELGQQFGLSIERIRNIESRSLNWLRKFFKDHDKAFQRRYE